MPGSSPGVTGAFLWARSRSASHAHQFSNSKDNFKRDFAISRRDAPEVLHLSLAPFEGVGNAGCPLHPRSRVHFVLVERTRVTTSTPERPAFPHAMVLTAYVVLSPVTGLFCHRRPQSKVLSAPGWADRNSANLTPASGRQDHTILLSAISISRRRAIDRSQVPKEPAPAIPSRAKRCRVHRIPCPTSVTIAIRPSCGTGCEKF
jgi:hypothetical protein